MRNFNSSPRQLSSSSSVLVEEEKEHQEDKEMRQPPFSAVSSSSSSSVAKQKTTVATPRQHSHHHSVSVVFWILLQLLAPVASMVAILQLLHYIRRDDHSSSHDDHHDTVGNIGPHGNGNDVDEVRRIRIDMSRENLDPALQGLRLADCQYFWAPSAIDSSSSSDAGYGVFTAIDMKRGAITQSMPDFCFEYEINDDNEVTSAKTTTADNAIRLESFFWSRDILFPASRVATTKGQRRRVLCQGMASLFNSMPDDERRVATSKVIPTAAAAAISTVSKKKNARLLDRSIVRDDGNDMDDDTNIINDGAWLFQANHKIPAGSELTVDYYYKQDPTATTTRTTATRTSRHLQKKFYDDNESSLNTTTADDAPRHAPEWLRQHGKCLDHVEIKEISITTIQSSSKSSSNSSSSIVERPGRHRRFGAFATRHLAKGSTVLPTPVLALANPKSSLLHSNKNKKSNPLPLWVNYCFQLPSRNDSNSSSNVLFFPYTPGIGAIHHNSETPNVAIRWSGADDDDARTLLLTSAAPGTVIYNLEVYALTNIRKGDELVMDFGIEWQTAYQEYQKSLLSTTAIATKRRSKDAKKSRPVFRHSIMLPAALLSSSATRSRKATTAAASSHTR